VLSVSNSEADEGSQTLWAHPLCLKNHLAVDGPLISELNDDGDKPAVAPGLIELLAVYIRALSDASEACRQTAERPRYEARLAGAARMFEALRRDSTGVALLPLLEAEQRALGWAYFSEAGGEKAERAFGDFASAATKPRPNN